VVGMFAVAFGVFATTFIIGLMLTQPAPTPRYLVIDYDARWKARVTYDGKTYSFGGVGVRAVRLPHDMKAVAGSAWKADGGDGTLNLLLVSGLDEQSLTWEPSQVMVENSTSLDEVIQVEWKG